MTLLYLKLLCIFLIFILVIGAFIFVRVRKQRNPFLKIDQSQKAANLDDEFASRGFFYSSKDEAFYTIKDAPQSKFGNCQLYDDTMPLIGMIVDCEPIQFDFGNRHWLIEFWKGQYCMASGCQIGTYSTLNDSIKVPGFHGCFYEFPDNKECCCITYTLKKKNKTLLSYTSKECFSAGLKVGEFSNPSSLSLKVKITFSDKKMLPPFIEGLKAAGYSGNEYHTFFNKVTVHFTKPHTTQPASRTRVQEAIIQQGNRYDCNKYTQLTSNCSHTRDKLNVLKNIDTELYEKVLKSFYSKELYGNYEAILPLLKKMSSPNDSMEEILSNKN